MIAQHLDPMAVVLGCDVTAVTGKMVHCDPKVADGVAVAGTDAADDVTDEDVVDDAALGQVVCPTMRCPVLSNGPSCRRLVLLCSGVKWNRVIGTVSGVTEAETSQKEHCLVANCF